MHHSTRHEICVQGQAAHSEASRIRQEHSAGESTVIKRCHPLATFVNLHSAIMACRCNKLVLLQPAGVIVMSISILKPMHRDQFKQPLGIATWLHISPPHLTFCIICMLLEISLFLACAIAKWSEVCPHAFRQDQAGQVQCSIVSMTIA